jgi:hypothetical protein
MNKWGSAVLVVLSALTACGSADRWCTKSLTPGEKMRTSPDTCTSARSVPLPLDSRTQSDHCVECTPRCGARQYPFGGEFSPEQFYTDTDLPAGACINYGEQCEMAATAPLSKCNGVVVGCAVNEYRCTCSLGEWRCVMTSQGGGACACEDAGILDAGGH